MDRRSLCAFINEQRYGVVSSIADDGTPQSALVGVAATSDLEIVFDTLKSSRKYRNLRQRPACSVVIGWSGEQTLQIDGFTEAPHGEALNRFHDAYFARWPDGRERAAWPQIAYLVIHPAWLRYSDFDQKLPFIMEVAGEAIAIGF